MPGGLQPRVPLLPSRMPVPSKLCTLGTQKSETVFRLLYGESTLPMRTTARFEATQLDWTALPNSIVDENANRMGNLAHESDNVTPRPRVVILGAGFGGLSAAKALANSPFDVTIVDQHNYHLFQPLLYQIMRDARNVSVVLAKVGKIDVGRREVVAENRRLPFDYLHRRDRRAARLFRSRRMGGRGAGPQDDRRRDVCVREGRD